MKPFGLLLFLAGLAAAGDSVNPQHSFLDDSHPLTGTTSNNGYDDNVITNSETLISILSASNQHSIFLHLIQRSKALPFLSRLNGTLFAPTDDAWNEWEQKHRPQSVASGDAATDVERVAGWLGPQGLGEWLTSPDDAEGRLRKSMADAEDDDLAAEMMREADNNNWALRQHILYHALNYTIHEDDWGPRQKGSNVTIETTLLFPFIQEPNPGPIPPPGAPWTWPRDGLLGDHGQRLRIALPGSAEGGDRGRVAVDHEGAGGTSVWDGKGWQEDKGAKGSKDKGPAGVRWGRNGVVIGVDGVLEPPPALDQIIAHHPKLTYLAKLLKVAKPLPKPLPPWMDRASHTTIFAASDDAFGAVFDDIERRYLEGGYGTEGVGRVLSPGVILALDGKQPVGWSDTWTKKPTLVNAASGVLEIESSGDGSLVVNGTKAESIDIFAANGVIHIVPQLILPPRFELLNSAEKVLLSRNATRFVSLLRSANLSCTYVGQPGNEAKKEWTILAPTDDAIELTEWWGGIGIPGISTIDDVFGGGSPSSGTSSSNSNTVATQLHRPETDVSPLAALLQYHIIPGRIAPSDLRDGMLLGTELRTKALGGNRQQLYVEISESRDTSTEIDDTVIRFGSARVTGEPTKSGKSIIYFVSSLLQPPVDVLQTALSDLELSTFIAAVYAAGLDRSVKTSEGTTFFIPHNKAFEQLGLGMKYLFLQEAKDELRKTLRYHSAEKLVYTPDLESGRTVVKTLEGGNIVINAENGTYTLSSPSKWSGRDSGASLPANGDLRPARLSAVNTLTETGVIHTIDSVIVPADVRLTILKLIRGSKQRVMADLMVKAGFTWILEGREPNSTELERVGLEGFVQPDRSTLTSSAKRNSTAELSLPAYTVLVPTDAAFARLNLSYYLSDEKELVNLVKQHIIPANLQIALPSSAIEHGPKLPPKDGEPLSLEDDVVYPTLRTPTARYGQVAFRRWGETSFLVGVHNARGGSVNDRAAQTGASGRASVRWSKSSNRDIHTQGGDDSPRNDDGDNDQGPNGDLWHAGMTLGGGVIVIDSVVVPYDPGWFERWGWLVMAVGITLSVFTLFSTSVWWWWVTTRKNRDGYARLATEEEEREQEEAARLWRHNSRNSRSGNSGFQGFAYGSTENVGDGQAGSHANGNGTGHGTSNGLPNGNGDASETSPLNGSSKSPRHVSFWGSARRSKDKSASPSTPAGHLDEEAEHE